MSSDPPPWFYQQAATIPCRRRDGSVEIAMITSRSGRRWVLPKGVIDPGETARIAAARETREEAGLAGTLSETSLGTYRYEKWAGTCTVEVFLLVVTEEMNDWPEAAVRRREWMTPDDASSRVREAGLRPLIERAVEEIGESDRATERRSD